MGKKNESKNNFSVFLNKWFLSRMYRLKIQQITVFCTKFYGFLRWLACCRSPCPYTLHCGSHPSQGMSWISECGYNQCRWGSGRLLHLVLALSDPTTSESQHTKSTTTQGRVPCHSQSELKYLFIYGTGTRTQDLVLARHGAVPLSCIPHPELKLFRESYV